ncbi:hypothetical protein H0H92_015845 [Tricholoma furcatifolium]|nr:hypothetical protein H0H92_015845 [Tricholoma furcatifolium]
MSDDSDSKILSKYKELELTSQQSEQLAKFRKENELSSQKSRHRLTAADEKNIADWEVIHVDQREIAVTFVNEKLEPHFFSDLPPLDFYTPDEVLQFKNAKKFFASTQILEDYVAWMSD